MPDNARKLDSAERSVSAQGIRADDKPVTGA